MSNFFILFLFWGQAFDLIFYFVSTEEEDLASKEEFISVFLCEDGFESRIWACSEGKC